MIAVFGAGGQVGGALLAEAAARSLAARGFTHRELDICDPGPVADALEGADAAVNCAAYTAVDKAESEAGTAWQVNAEGPGIVAAACADRDLPLVHISTDYVFGGEGERPWREEDPVAPLSEYGRGKAAGDETVRRRCPRHLILRPAWVFSAGGHNFVRTILRLARERDRLRIVDDQRGGPTAADDIAGAILAMLAQAGEPEFDRWGTYHYCGAPATTWCGFARAICRAAGLNTPIEPIPTTAFPTPARRPANSVLDCSRIKTVFGIDQPDWRAALERVVPAIEGESTNQ